MALWQAIERYHELLNGDIAAESQGQLSEQQRRRGLYFGDRPLATVLRPRFMTPEQYHHLEGRVRLVMRAFQKAYDAAMADADIRRQFGLADWEESLIGIDPGYREPHPTARLDAFYVSGRGGLRFMEYNGEVPASPAYNDVLTELYLGLPIMRQFLKLYSVRPLPARHSTMHALTDAYVQWLGRRERPRIAILDWREVPTYSEFVLFDDYFRQHGYESRIVDPREVEYRGGKLVAGDYQIDLIYKRVLIAELVERGGLDHPVIRAVRDRAVCMVNPFRCKILHKKASLAVLSDERNAHLFSADEREAIELHIPWTRRVEDRATVHNGQPVDLLPYIAQYRENLVLKANDEYGGKGIYLGWETPAEEWEQALRRGLEEPFVVQERVDQVGEPYPSMVDGALQVYERLMDTNPYVFYGAYMDGCLTRLSTQSLLNVTSGGGSTAPTLMVVDRE
jgi:glutathionylspermidine synthase